MNRLELSIAWRYLRTRGGSRLFSFISAIAIGGVLVGVSALIVINGVMTGMQTDLRDKILVGSPDLRVLTYGDDLTMPKWRDALARVRQQPGVLAVAPFVLTQGLAQAGHNYPAAVYVEGIEPSGRGVPEITSVRHTAKQGDFRFLSEDGTGHGAVVGARLADRLDLAIGDKLTIISPAGSKFSASVGFVVPRTFEFQVSGIFETGMYEYDDSYIYVSLPVAQQFANLGDAVTGLEARTTSRNAAGAIGERIRTTLGYPYRVVDWQQQNSSLFHALKLEKLAMGVILLLIVVVAAFNIVSTLTMVVTDKTREIGILKAMGLRSSAVLRVFLMQGLVIGVVGTGIGLVVGITVGVLLDRYKLIALDPGVYFIDHLPVSIQPLDVLWIVLASIAIATLATLYPSLQAARLYPVEAIRHE
ncbi:MAG TPA: ABC transporter permease [Gemmatimonadaceae bacterium]|nr:ABC transporter permease [Gemmatimonadaceae bacterium]